MNVFPDESFDLLVAIRATTVFLTFLCALKQKRTAEAVLSGIYIILFVLNKCF